MNDTSPDVAGRFRAMLLERSNEERLRMCAQSFEAARSMILASLPVGLTEKEARCALLVRLYGDDLDEGTLRAVMQLL